MVTIICTNFGNSTVNNELGRQSERKTGIQKKIWALPFKIFPLTFSFGLLIYVKKEFFEIFDRKWPDFLYTCFSFILSPRLNIDHRVTKVSTNDHYYIYNTGLKSRYCQSNMAATNPKWLH